jgi:uncharacterized protein YjbI with pentapeptide repeats
MANEEHLKILMQGVNAWNQWKSRHRSLRPNLRGANISGMSLNSLDLIGADLRGANITEADLSDAALRGTLFGDADLRGAKFGGANLHGAQLDGADLRGAHLEGANLQQANFRDANLGSTFLRGADLGGAKLQRTNLSRARLEEASFHEARMTEAIFAGIDLREVKELESVQHHGPSYISIDTIYQSEGKIPEIFLRGCGVPDEFITQIPSLVAAMQPIQFHSCFISYSSNDEDFARRLHERMRASGLRVWFAPEDIKGGEKLYEQIDRAIQVHDRLLLVLSESSLQSEWVMTEIRRARKAEVKENRRKLFPIRLTDYETLKEWECFDVDVAKDLAVEVREYFIPDFSNWKSHDDFEKAFARLLSDLKASI